MTQAEKIELMRQFCETQPKCNGCPIGRHCAHDPGEPWDEEYDVISNDCVEALNRHLVTHSEAVDHPAHYQSAGGLEVIDVIEAFGLGFRLGNAIKYILRAGHKDDRLQDLRKALWYLQREISKEEEIRK